MFTTTINGIPATPGVCDDGWRYYRASGMGRRTADCIQPSSYFYRNGPGRNRAHRDCRTMTDLCGRNMSMGPWRMRNVCLSGGLT